MLRPRTKVIKVGTLTFRKKLRNPTSAEKAENKKERLYYRKNKSKIKRAAAIRAKKIERTPKLKLAKQLRNSAKRLMKEGKSPSAAVNTVKRRMATKKTNVKKK